MRWSGVVGALMVVVLVAGCAVGPDPSAGSLFDAWTRGDSAAGKPYATSEALFALFSLPYRSSDGWEFSRCEPAGARR